MRHFKAKFFARMPAHRHGQPDSKLEGRKPAGQAFGRSGFQIRLETRRQNCRRAWRAAIPLHARAWAETGIGLAYLERSFRSPQKKLDRHADRQAIQAQASYRHSDRVFMRHARRFARVAAPAGHDDIVDCVGAPARKWHGMVDGPFTPGEPDTTVAAFAVCSPQGLQFTAGYIACCRIFSGSPVGSSRSLTEPVMRRKSSVPPLSVSVHDTIVPRLSAGALAHDPVGRRHTAPLVKKQCLINAKCDTLGRSVSLTFRVRDGWIANHP